MPPQWTEQSRQRALEWARICLPPILYLLKEEIDDRGLPSVGKKEQPYLLKHWPHMDEDHSLKGYLKEVRLMIREGKLDLIFHEGPEFIKLVRKIFAGKYPALNQKRSQTAWEQKYVLEEESVSPSKRPRSRKWQVGHETQGSWWVKRRWQKMETKSDDAKRTAETKDSRSKLKLLQDPSTLPAHHCDRLMAELEARGTFILEEDAGSPVQLTPPRTMFEEFQKSGYIFNVEAESPNPASLGKPSSPESRPVERHPNPGVSPDASSHRAQGSRCTMTKELFLARVGAGAFEMGTKEAQGNVPDLRGWQCHHAQQAMIQVEASHANQRYLAGSGATHSHGEQVTVSEGQHLPDGQPVLRRPLFQAPPERLGLPPTLPSLGTQKGSRKDKSERPKLTFHGMDGNRSPSQSVRTGSPSHSLADDDDERMTDAAAEHPPLADPDPMDLEPNTCPSRPPHSSPEASTAGMQPRESAVAHSRVEPTASQQVPQPEASDIQTGERYLVAGVPRPLAYDEYKGFAIEAPAVMLARINNFLSDEDIKRYPKWRSNIAEITEYVNWLVATRQGEDFGGQFSSALDKLRVHRIHEDHHFRQPEIPKSFPDIWKEKRREVSAQKFLYSQELIKANWNQPLRVDRNGQDIPPQYMKCYLDYWERDWRLMAADEHKLVSKRFENMYWVQELARWKHERRLVTSEEMKTILDEESKFVFNIEDIILEEPETQVPSFESRVSFARYRGTLLAFQFGLNEERISIDHPRFDELRPLFLQLRPFPSTKPRNIPLGYKRSPASPGIFIEPIHPFYTRTGKGAQEAFVYTKKLGFVRREEHYFSSYTKRTVESRYEKQAKDEGSDRVYHLPSLRGPRIPMELDTKGAEARELLASACSTLRALKLEDKRRPRELITNILAMYQAGLQGDWRKDQAEALGLRFRERDYKNNELQWLDLQELDHLTFLTSWPDPFKGLQGQGYLSAKHKIFHQRVIKLLRDPWEDHFKGAGDKEGISLADLMRLVNSLAVGSVQKIKFRRDDIVVRHGLSKLIIALMLEEKDGRYTRAHPELYPEHRIGWSEDVEASRQHEQRHHGPSGQNDEGQSDKGEKSLQTAAEFDEFESDVSMTLSELEEDRIMKSMPDEMNIAQWRKVKGTLDDLNKSRFMAETENFFNCLAFRLGITLQEDALPEHHARLTNMALKGKMSTRQDSRAEMIRDWLQELRNTDSLTYRDALSGADGEDLEPKSAAITLQNKIIEELSDNHNSIWAPKQVSKELEPERTFRREPLWLWAVPSRVRDRKPMFWRLDKWPQQVDLMWERCDVRHFDSRGGYRTPLKYTGYNLKEWMESREFKIRQMDALILDNMRNGGVGHKGEPHQDERRVLWADVDSTPPQITRSQGEAVQGEFPPMPIERLLTLQQEANGEKGEIQAAASYATGDKRKRVESDATCGRSRTKAARLSGDGDLPAGKKKANLSLPVNLWKRDPPAQASNVESGSGGNN